MSGLNRRMSSSSQTSNSPLLPRSNGDGTHGWRDVLENKMTWAYVLTSMALCVRYHTDWAKMVHEHHVLWGCGIDIVQSSIWVSRSLGFGYACARSGNRLPTLISVRLGGIIYIASLVGFILLLATHIVRFSLKPRLIRASITHPSEGLFVSTFAAALGILIVDGATYAEKMHTAHGIALRTSFWIFLVVALIFGVGSPLAQCAPLPALL